MKKQKAKAIHSSVLVTRSAPDSGLPVAKEAARYPDRRGADPEDEKPLLCRHCFRENGTWGRLKGQGVNRGRFWCRHCGRATNFIIDPTKEFGGSPESAPEGGAGPGNDQTDRRGTNPVQ